MGFSAAMNKKGSAPGEITRLLRKLEKNHDPVAANELTNLVYAELHSRAQAVFRKERSGHLLQPTALVNETFIRLMEGRTPSWKSRGQFFGVAVRLMRQILVDHARQANAKKRGSGVVHESIDEAIVFSMERPDVIIELDDALKALEAMNPRQAQVVEMRYFGGFEIGEVAKFLGVSRTTVGADWDLAKAFLRRELSK